MRLRLSAFLLCLFWMQGLCALEVHAATSISLHGEGSVVKELDVERIDVAGMASGYISGTFVWEEEHDLAPVPEEAIEHGTITITDQNGDTITLSFSGRATMREAEEAVLEGAKGSFTYLEGTGRWAERPLSGTYTKAGVFGDDSVKLSITLTVKGD